MDEHGKIVADAKTQALVRQIRAVCLDPADSVVTLCGEARPGDLITYRRPDKTAAECSMTALQAVPMYHKIAVRDIAAGEPVYKYGERIGLALIDIKAGQHVHEHNLASPEIPFTENLPVTDGAAERWPEGVSFAGGPEEDCTDNLLSAGGPSAGGRTDKCRAGESLIPMDSGDDHIYAYNSDLNDEAHGLRTGVDTFMGYRRPDGRVGIRNYVAIMAGTLCAAPAAEQIYDRMSREFSIPGQQPMDETRLIYLYNPNGCAQTPDDTGRTLDILSGLIANGNIYGALIVGLGCEGLQEEDYRRAVLEKAKKPLFYMKIQDEGLEKTVQHGCEIIRGLMAEAAGARRTPCPVSDLIIGLECGGSDPTSGFAANPVLGIVSDQVVDQGGSAVLSETPEAIGAEHILRRRGATPEIGQQIFDAVRANEWMFRELGLDVRSGNPSPGNKASGITTLEEKSMGCIHKSGSRPFEAVYGYGQQITHKGLAFMDTTAYDVASTVAKIAGGCQTVLFTTGMGTPVGCAAAPVIKITGNPRTAAVMADMIDFSAADVTEGLQSVPELGEALYALLLRVCSGARVKAEENGACSISINQMHSMC